MFYLLNEMTFFEAIPIEQILNSRFCKQEIEDNSRQQYRGYRVNVLTSSHAASSFSLNSVSLEGILSWNRQETPNYSAFSLSKRIVDESQRIINSKIL